VLIALLFYARKEAVKVEVETFYRFWLTHGATNPWRKRVRKSLV
jgi:hypothetical protein